MVDIQSYNKRIALIILMFLGFTLIIGAQLFNLQVFKYKFYIAKATANQQGYKVLDSRRGEIYIEDYHSGSDFRVATNITLDTIFADPTLIEDSILVGEELAGVLFNEQLALEKEEQRLKEQRKTLSEDLNEEQVAEILKPKNVTELRLDFRDELITKMSESIRNRILLYENPTDKVREKIRALKIEGIEVTDKNIFAYPKSLVDKSSAANSLSAHIGINPERLTRILEGKNRYVVLASKIEPQKSEKLREMVKNDRRMFRGIGFEQKTYRFYPEKQLAAQVLGFVSANSGVYGIEAYYDDLLKGEQGVFQTKLDGLGKQITVGDDTLIKPALDGANVYLTIDRSIQLESERLLREYVMSTRSDAGQVVVMEPETGKIMALAHYPTFNPDEYWKALDTEEFFVEEEDADKIERISRAGTEEVYFVRDAQTEDRLQLLPVKSEKTGGMYYEKFKNNVGGVVYRNRVISDLFEPGSIFKPITMSIAIDADIVTPNTTINDSGPIKVDEFTINNALGKNYGVITMTQALETSNNIAMAWLSRQIGRSLFHNYLLNYGFARRTDIQMVNEHTGRLRPFSSWAESELVTHAFGQGFSATPIQMVSAISALANNGVLMQPTLVNRVEYQNGNVDEFDPITVRKVISKKTADTLRAMMVSVVDKGQSSSIKLPNYSVAGKTGTSQTYKNGKPLSGPGTTIASFVGFAPASDPKYVILVKLDKPRTSPWADQTAMPLFAELNKFLLQYLAIPPDRLR